MASIGTRSPALDFVVIGAQKAGTTSLWQYLRGHPAIAMPASKEAPFFCMEAAERAGALEGFVRDHFADAGDRTLLGTATPQYMTGFRGVPVEEIAARMSAAIPRARLIALLRDPIDRAFSHYRMSVRRGLETRTFEEVAGAALEPGQLAEARARPTETNSHLVAGEYGRILQAYRSRFPAEQLHVELTSALEANPGGVLDRVLEFLGLRAGYRPEGLGVRHHRGGSAKRLDAEAEAALLGFMRESVLPRLGDQAPQAALELLFFYETWNVVPSTERARLSAGMRARLEAHYVEDAELLRASALEPDWTRAWSGEGSR